jgi:hypothetical protein
MAKVVAIMSMSLDGFVADPADGVEEVFRWYGAGGGRRADREVGIRVSRLRAERCAYARVTRGDRRDAHRAAYL